jgi:hypothetical protein
MSPVRRGASRLAALLSLGAGLVLGVGIGLPSAHWVSGVLIHPPLASSSPSAGSSSPPARPQSSGTLLPSSSATPTSSSTATPSPPTCSPLAHGQQSLDPLQPPPSGYTADASLDWVGCGDTTVPAVSPFTVSGPWLVAVSYTCPSGTAAETTGPTLIVSQAGVSAGSSPEAVAEAQGDDANAIYDGLSGSSLGPGSFRLEVAAAPACLWHLAVYRG